MVPIIPERGNVASDYPSGPVCWRGPRSVAERRTRFNADRCVSRDTIRRVRADCTGSHPLIGLVVNSGNDRGHGVPETCRRGGKDRRLIFIGIRGNQTPVPALFVQVLLPDARHPAVGNGVERGTDFKDAMARWVIRRVAHAEQDMTVCRTPHLGSQHSAATTTIRLVEMQLWWHQTAVSVTWATAPIARLAVNHVAKTVARSTAYVPGRPPASLLPCISALLPSLQRT